MKISAWLHLLVRTSDSFDATYLWLALNPKSWPWPQLFGPLPPLCAKKTWNFHGLNFWKLLLIRLLLIWKSINPQAPVAKKSADEVVFRYFQGEGVEFFFLNRTSLTPHQIFNAHLLETTDLSPSRFHFSVGFITRSWFESDGFIAYSNEWDWSEKERCLFTLTNL